MNTAIENRNETYANINGELSARCAAVLAAIRTLRKAGRDVTAKRIARYLEVPINQVTGRLTELRDNYVRIKEIGTEIHGKRMSTKWEEITDPCERREAIYERYRQLTDQIEALESDYLNGNSEYTTQEILKKIDKIQSQLNIIKKL